MAMFSRKALQEKGFNDVQIDYIMTESGRKLAADYALKSEVKEQIDDAVRRAQEEVPPIDVKETEDYKALLSQFDGFKAKVEAKGTLLSKGVKEKFFDQVYEMLDKEKDTEEQLAAIREQFEEYFAPEKEVPAKNTPVFSKQPGQSATNMSAEDQLVAEIREAWD